MHRAAWLMRAVCLAWASEARPRSRDGCDGRQHADEGCVQIGHLRRVGACRLAHSRQHIDALQQHFDMVAAQHDTAFLGGHKAVLHHVSQPFRRAELHDARCPLEGMCRPHQGLEAVSVLRIAFQC
jgi:hypothetical protein